MRIGLVSRWSPADQLAGSRYRPAPSGSWRCRGTAVTEIKALLLAAADRSQAEQELAEREAQYRQLRLVGWTTED